MINPIVIRVLILALIFASVMLAAEAIGAWIRRSTISERAINRRLKLISTGQDRGQILSKLRRDDDLSGTGTPSLLDLFRRRIARSFHSAGLTTSVESAYRFLLAAPVLLLAIIVLVAASAGYTVTYGLFVICAAFSVALCWGVPMMVISRMAQRRRKKMEEQFPVALDTFVRGLRAGHPVSAAIELLTTEMEDPIGSEFGIIADEVAYGSDLREALQRMADRWQIEELHMFVISLSIQSETGGNLAEILEKLSGVVRERASLFLKVRALSSEGRMTALILTALPILAFIGLFIVNPAFYLDVAGERGFLIGFPTLIVMYFAGLFTIRRMIDLKV
jgi:tight adherence protein B